MEEEEIKTVSLVEAKFSQLMKNSEEKPLPNDVWSYSPRKGKRYNHNLMIWIQNRRIW